MSGDAFRDAIYEAVAPYIEDNCGPFQHMDIVDAILDMPEMEALLAKDAEIERLRAEVERLKVGLKMLLRAEMARRGLLHTQLAPYVDDDTEKVVRPREESDNISAAWEFLTWLDKKTDAPRD